MDFHAPLRMALTEVVLQDESLHLHSPGLGHEATETSYYGFNIPEAGIDAEIYFWLHPALGMMSGGIWIWQGRKRLTLEADYFSYYAYLPFPAEGILDYSPMPGMRVRVEDPLKRIAVDYFDEVADTRVELMLEAMFAPVGRPGGGHFTQAMRTSGRLRLRGVEHRIDGSFVRDRSWGDVRSERPRSLPPTTWMVGVFDDDLVFHARAFDDPAANPDWAGSATAIAPDDRFRWGYIVERGEIIQLADCRMKRTTRTPDGISPSGYSMELVDVNGRVLALVGEVVSRLPMQMWPNMLTHYCLTRWTLDDRTGWGDAQDIQYADYIRAFARG